MLTWRQKTHNEQEKKKSSQLMRCCCVYKNVIYWQSLRFDKYTRVHMKVSHLRAIHPQIARIQNIYHKRLLVWQMNAHDFRHSILDENALKTHNLYLELFTFAVITNMFTWGTQYMWKNIVFSFLCFPCGLIDLKMNIKPACVCAQINLDCGLAAKVCTWYIRDGWAQISSPANNRML